MHYQPMHRHHCRITRHRVHWSLKGPLNVISVSCQRFPAYLRHCLNTVLSMLNPVSHPCIQTSDHTEINIKYPQAVSFFCKLASFSEGRPQDPWFPFTDHVYYREANIRRHRDALFIVNEGTNSFYGSKILVNVNII